MKPIIAPSILSADFARLGEEVTSVLNAGADWIHFDVMDNHYVPNLTVGPLVLKALREHGIQAPMDVHLMVDPVDRIIGDFASAGATSITFHPEASRHIDRTIQIIRDNGCSVGLALNPATSMNYLNHTLSSIDLILLMSVNPGFGGQKFIPYVLDKIRETRHRITQSELEVRIQVDGGITVGNISNVANAGADTFVAGSAIFGAADYASVIGEMRRQIG